MPGRPAAAGEVASGAQVDLRLERHQFHWLYANLALPPRPAYVISKARLN